MSRKKTKGNQRKKPRDLSVTGPCGLFLGSLAERLDSAPSPVTDRRDSGKPPEPSIGKQPGGREGVRQFPIPRENGMSAIFDSKRPGPTAIEPGPAIFSDLAEDAAARRATRRLPLGEPPLVVTTHAITSLRQSHPGSVGVQPRTEAGSSPSYHDRTTRVS